MYTHPYMMMDLVLLPFLGIYYTVNLVLLTLATSLSVLVINISRCEKPMPEVLRKVRYLLMISDQNQPVPLEAKKMEKQ